MNSKIKAGCFLADIGHYHVARFGATAKLGELVVIDAGANISTAYESAATKSYTAVPVEGTVAKTLDAIAPDVLVVMGWGYRSVREGGLVGLGKSDSAGNDVRQPTGGATPLPAA